MSKYADIRVKTRNPEVLDKTVQTFGAVVLQDDAGVYSVDDGCYVVRIFGDPGFVKYAIETQGYGEVVE